MKRRRKNALSTRSQVDLKLADLLGVEFPDPRRMIPRLTNLMLLEPCGIFGNPIPPSPRLSTSKKGRSRPVERDYLHLKAPSTRTGPFPVMRSIKPVHGPTVAALCLCQSPLVLAVRGESLGEPDPASPAVGLAEPSGLYGRLDVFGEAVEAYLAGAVAQAGIDSLIERTVMRSCLKVIMPLVLRVNISQRMSWSIAASEPSSGQE